MIINVSGRGLRVSWDINTENVVSGYKVYMKNKLTSDITVYEVSGRLMSFHVIKDLQPNNMWETWITAHNGSGMESEKSKSLHLWIGETLEDDFSQTPVAPENFLITFGPTLGEMNFTWDAVISSSGKYLLDSRKRLTSSPLGSSGVSDQEFEITTTNHTITVDPNVNATYTFTVSAFGGPGFGDDSITIGVSYKDGVPTAKYERAKPPSKLKSLQTIK